MNKNIAFDLRYQKKSQLVCPTQDADVFRDRIVDLLDGKACANLSTYFYSSPKFSLDRVNGYGLFRDLCKHPSYYLHREETALIHSVCHELSDLIGAEPTFIELGPGAREAVTRKTLPILESAQRPQSYVAVDYNSISAVQAAEAVLGALPQIRAEVVTEDFTNLAGFGDGRRNPVFLMFGNTLGNIEGPPNVFNPNIVSYLQKLRRVVGQKGKLLIAYDCNQNYDMVHEAYNNSLAKSWVHNIIFRMQRDADVKIDPEGFEPYADFRPDSCCVEIGLRALRNQTIGIGRKSWGIAEGARLHVYNSYKFAPKILRPLLQRAGFATKAMFINARQTTALELLEPLKQERA